MPMKGELGNKTASERGASLVEFSLVLPILLVIVLGILEMGMAFRSVITVGSAAQEGARVASFKGNDIDADCVALESVIAELGDEIDLVTAIKIYRVDSAGNPEPLKTNTYAYSGVGDITDCTKWNGTVLWPSTDRKVTVGTTPLDVLGVEVSSTHTWVTQFPPFGGSIGVDESTIVRLEPEAYDT
jgi:Flp pilus assembly protein TadG